MPPEDYTMLAKFFLVIKNKHIKKLFLLQFSLFLYILFVCFGCSDSRIKNIGVWKTVLEGDWSARLNDVHFISITHGWTVGSSIGIAPNHSLNSSDEDNPVYTDGAESIILHTKDGGKNWIKQNSGIYGKPLHKVFFRNESDGWCIGDGGVVIHTTDGGNTWQRVETGTKNDLNSLYFSDNIGWIVGDWSTLLLTVDGGKSFNRVVGSVFEKQSLKNLSFIDNDNGWVITNSTSIDNVNSGYIYNTNDGGQTWQKQFSTSFSLFGIHFVDKLSGWVVGDKRSLYATNDGGKTWKYVTDGSNKRHKEDYGQPEYLGNEPLHTFTLYDIDFTDNQHGWIVGDLGVILRTTSGLKKDGTSVWKHQRGGPRFHNSADGVLLGVDFVTNKVGWAVGENGTILHTRNGGITWEAQSNPTHLLFDVCITSNNMAFVVGDRGTILQTQDGGNNWNSQDSRTAECFGGTHFVTPKKGWSVAEAGVILHTTNGGAIWLPQKSNTTQDLLAVYFIDEETGWCVGSAGEIVHTSDGGLTWSRQNSGVIMNLFDIHFTTKKEGWIVGLFGTLLYTVDGGENWHFSTLTQQLKKNGYTQNVWFNAVYFITPQIGWVVGVDGLVFHTDDGGETWSRQQVNTLNFLYDVYFISKDEGWIVGKNGLILHTQDRGKNWRPQRTDTQTDLTAIHMSSPYNGLVAGQGGTILKYEVIERE